MGGGLHCLPLKVVATDNGYFGNAGWGIEVAPAGRKERIGNTIWTFRSSPVSGLGTC